MFGLELHPDKTRRIEFGRYSEENRKRRGEGKPETWSNRTSGKPSPAQLLHGGTQRSIGHVNQSTLRMIHLKN
jgi:hypothetical protein